jgi:hypothetical protein
MAYFLVAFFVIGTAFLTWKFIQLWKSPELVEWFMTTFTILPFGRGVRRGEIRALGLTATSLWAATVLIFFGLQDGDMSSAVLALGGAALVILLLCVLCEVSVVLFNRPKFVVPPHMRSDLGVVAERRARRRTTRKKPEGRR